MTLLLAEKDSASAAQMEQLLTALGFAVLIEPDFAAACRALGRAGATLALIRADDPDGAGLELCRRVRTAPVRQPVTMVLYGKGAADGCASWIEAGADDILLLPCRKAEIVARLELAVSRSRLAVRADEAEEELSWMRTELENQRAQADQTFTNLSVANNRFSELFQGLPVACFSYDQTGTIYEWNRAAIELTGYQPHEAFGKPIWQVLRVSGATAQRRNVRERKEAIRRIFAGETLLDIEMTTCRKDGSAVDVLSNTFPIFAPDGQITGAICANIDISQRKALELQVEEQLQIATALNKELDAHRAELESANTRLAALATVDGLTGLKNHRAFQEHLEAEFQRARRAGGELSVVLLDVDRFKLYNDTFGHPAGDEVLKAVSRALESCVRHYDFVARYGGEEFIVILPGTGVEQAVNLAERMRSRLASAEWPNREVTASFGAATLCPGTMNRKQLIAEADAALYVSKAQGRNRVTHFTQTPAASLDAAA
jgi:two-component system cell cycle response regulator